MIDGIVYGEEKGNLVFIISTKHHEIAKRIIEDLERSANAVERIWRLFSQGDGNASLRREETTVCSVKKDCSSS